MFALSDGKQSENNRRERPEKKKDMHTCDLVQLLSAANLFSRHVKGKDKNRDGEWKKVKAEGNRGPPD